MSEAGVRAAVPAHLRPADRFDLWQTIEALRLGVVPRHRTQDYTVGRAKELAKLESMLTEGRGLRLLWGEYGAGKTHLLDVMESTALRLGYATARAVLDPRDVPPSHPLRLYRALAAGLRYPDEAAEGIGPLFHRLGESAAHLDPASERFSRFLSPALFAQHHATPETAALAREYVEGHPSDHEKLQRRLERAKWAGPGLLATSDFRTYGRVYVHLIGSLSVWLRDAGWRGLVLLLDEVEYVDSLDSEHLRLATDVLKHFAAATLPREQLHFDAETDLYRGGQSVHKQLPLLFAPDQPLCAVMAFTPLAEIESMMASILASDEPNVRISALGAEAYHELVDRVTALYERTYPQRQFTQSEKRVLHDDGLKSLSGGFERPRAAIRDVVSVLDMLRCGIRRKAPSETT